MTPTPNFTWDEIDALRAETVVGDDPAPGRSFTIQEYADRYGIPPSTASNQLRRLAAAGKLMSGRKLAMNARGQMISAQCYWKP